MGQERAVVTHLKAAEEYLEAARKILSSREYFAVVLCAATGIERAAMALVLHLGARPAAKHRHHEVLRTLQPLVVRGMLKDYSDAVDTIAELMGHLTTVRYKYEMGGDYKTPRELYGKADAMRLYHKAQRALRFIQRYISKER